jgi:hypothetical protein
MPYTVRLRNNATREVRDIAMTDDWCDGFRFLWSDGNFGCDCNRGLFFAEAAGEPEPDPDVHCGSELFTAIEAALPSGERIPLDDDEPAHAGK